ncbi:hypothetical protein [Bacillus sp. REN3]|uniref:hypothetical protein n=1 Tax=Bacillus sp. REN3 TaxID=2802440 RepID=UPI001AEE8217|nr:hypothetical protein [Bacillus sp. REN3]
MSFSDETIVSLRPLTIRKDKKHYIVEDKESGDFYEMPEVCVAAIELLDQGVPLGQAEGALRAQFPDEEVELFDFVYQLLELELVGEIDGADVERKTITDSQSGFGWIPAGIGRFFFNQLTSKLYILLLVGIFLILIFNPGFFPKYKDLFVFNLMLKNVAAWLLVTSILVLVHEFGHVLAARSENLPAKVGIGHRLFFVVLETDLTQAWSLPAERRNKLYLAGMYFDITVLFAALSAQLFIDENALIASFLRLAVLDTFVRLVYQTGVFMKTDLYYVLENMTGCYNLMEEGQFFLGRWLPFLKERDTEALTIEEKVVRPYAVFYLAGIAVTCALAAFYYIPQLLFAVKEFMLPGLAEPLNSLRFWDSAVFMLQIGIVLSLLLYSWTKKYRLSS